MKRCYTRLPARTAATAAAPAATTAVFAWRSKATGAEQILHCILLQQLQTAAVLQSCSLWSHCTLIVHTDDGRIDKSRQQGGGFISS